MKNLLRTALVAVLAFGVSLSASAQVPTNQKLQLTMQDGRVTIIATDVPVRQILDEWSRIGQTKIVNGEKLSGPPVTLQIVNKTEREALDILLRSAAGYMAAPRPDGTAGVSAYDRITILATSRAPAPTATPATASAQPFQRQQQQPPPQPVVVDDDDDEPVNVNVPPQQMPQQAPVIAPFPGAPNGAPVAPGVFPGSPNNAAPVSPYATPTPQIEGSQPRFQPGMMPMQTPGQQPTQPMTAPRPGMLPQAPQNGVPNPNQVPRPGEGGEGGEGG
jgi:hypothetical protein